MDKEFKSFIEGIEENIKAEITVYDEFGNYLFGNDDVAIEKDFDGIFVDEANTLFKLKYKSKSYIAKIKGTSEKESGYAYLISSLAEKSSEKSKKLTIEEFYKKLLFENLTYYEISNYIEEYKVKDKDLFTMLITCPKGRTSEVLEVLSSYTQDENDKILQIDNTKVALIKFVDEEVEEYRSVKEYGEFLYQSINEITGIHAGIYIGCTVKSISDLSISYSQAVLSERMGEGVDLNGHVHLYKEYSLIRMLEDLPKYKLNEYLSLLLEPSARDIFEDKEMLITAEEFLENGLNISETSRKMYLHRNTLTYRLDKIEKATGLDLRKFSDALTFRLIVILSKLVG